MVNFQSEGLVEARSGAQRTVVITISSVCTDLKISVMVTLIVKGCDLAY